MAREFFADIDLLNNEILRARAENIAEADAGPPLQGRVIFDPTTGTLKYGDGTAWVASLGETGPTGPTGSQGATGPTGSPGSDGAAGIPGSPGDPGPTGPTGAVGSEGVQGVPGTAGRDGVDGVNGAAGATGPPGLPGTQGIQGVQGVTGATGPAGAPGEVGPAGLNYRGAWSSATVYAEDDLVTYNGSGWYCHVPVGPSATVPANDTAHWSLLVLQGAPGPTGPQGIGGAAGAPGGLGPTGPAGGVGATGPQGARGAAGAVGPTGAQGVAGPRGDAGPPGGGTLSGRVNGAINASQTTFDATLNQEWPTGPINNHILIDNELMLVSNAVLQSGQTYRLTVLRAQLGTAAATHKANEVLYLRPPALATTLLPPATSVAKVGTSLQAARADHDHGIVGGGGGGAADLNALTDVTLTSPADGQGLTFDSVSGQWRNTAAPVGPTGPTGLAGPTGPPGNTGNPGSPGTPGGVGPTGPTGSPGQQGIQGVPGGLGPTGPAGTGATGATGPTGAAGAVSTVPGPTGPTGPAGSGGSAALPTTGYWIYDDDYAGDIPMTAGRMWLANPTGAWGGWRMYLTEADNRGVSHQISLDQLEPGDQFGAKSGITMSDGEGFSETIRRTGVSVNESTGLTARWYEVASRNKWFLPQVTGQGGEVAIWWNYTRRFAPGEYLLSEDDAGGTSPAWAMIRFNANVMSAPLASLNMMYISEYDLSGNQSDYLLNGLPTGTAMRLALGQGGQILLTTTGSVAHAYDTASGQYTWRVPVSVSTRTGYLGEFAQLQVTRVGGGGGGGATGPIGPTGPTGPTGAAGVTGATGAASTVTGPTGATGPTGPAGTGGGDGGAGAAYAADLAAGMTATVTHNLGTKDVSVTVYRTSDDAQVQVNNVRTSANVVTLNSGVDLAGHRVVVLASGGVTTPARQTASFTTASLAASASDTGTVTLAPGYRLLRVQTSAPARVRLYESTAARSADASRPIGTDPSGDSGLMLELITTTGDLDWGLSPLVDGYLTTGSAVPWSVTNLSESVAAVSCLVTWIQTEA